MKLTLRITKGIPLTVEELDGNFTQLENRICALERGAHHDLNDGLSDYLDDGVENKPPLILTQDNDVVIFKNRRGNEMGRAVLPRWVPRHRGAYACGEFYALSDWVRYAGSLYFCKTPHIAGEFDADKWELLFDLKAETNVIATAILGEKNEYS
jgi:hypothetical protein